MPHNNCCEKLSNAGHCTVLRTNYPKKKQHAQTGVPDLIDDCLMYLVEASWQSFRFCLLLNLFKIGSTSTWQVLN